jgi:Sigma-70 region 2/Transposase IS66 family
VSTAAGKKAEGLVNLFCRAHIRRYFVRAGDANPAQLTYWTQAWLERIKALYAAHERLMAAWARAAAPAPGQAAGAAVRLEQAHAGSRAVDGGGGTGAWLGCRAGCRFPVVPATGAGNRRAAAVRWMGVGTREDFAEFYRRSKDECLFTILVSVGDRDTAQDLVAEAFARAWASWRTVSRHPAPQAWVVRTALNANISWWRRRRREVPVADPDRIADRPAAAGAAWQSPCEPRAATSGAFV